MGTVRTRPAENHGQSRTKLYGVWAAMIRRCYNPNDKEYARYGGRGINVCDRWRQSFVAFRDDLGDRPTPRHSLDRIDGNGHYEPGNVRWATLGEQNRNKRNNVRLEFRGQVKTRREWCRLLGVSERTVRNRLSRGWSVERALTEPAVSAAFGAARRARQREGF